MSATPTAAVGIASQILGLIGQQDPMGRGDDVEVGKALRACARDQLLTFSRQLGLSGVTKLAKDALAGRIAAALLAARSAAPPRERDEENEENATGNDEATASKFDLGPDVVESRPPQTIPWGYGSDRVTAMAVDPNRLYVYWEVTDAAIATARKQLGAGGADAWLSLRVYDITGRLFDGTNAHSYFDEGVGRDVRQWFFEIGKPTSTTCVEVGLKSNEGFFVRVARSGRVEFPREAPLPSAGSVEWLTVRTATGVAGQPLTGGAPHPDGYVGPGTLGGASSEDWQDWSDGAGFPTPGGGGGGVTRSVEGGFEWRETGETHVHHELGRVEWVGPVERSEWQAGPFTHPVDALSAPSMIEHHESGEVTMRTEDGIVHLVYGPWQVVIRGTGARAERRVLATWEYRRTIELPGGAERDDAALGQWEPVAPGASEWRLVGASERRWLGASELLFRGGSEVWLMGASERFFKGASERLFKGASERLYRGASERLKRGASERRLGGASERTIEGGFAAGFPGASERHAAGRLGASENSGATSTSTSPDDVDVPMPYPRPER
ncbi:MAG TPA: DUF4912 domain-containing protein [Polyangia bacterium]|nr:DUF4912 domain-containing protein [Polyangia bacterium]